MEAQTWGAGPKTLLFIPGGPGSGLPRGRSGRLSRRWFGPFLEAGYAVHYVTRRRGMPPGHTVADMAADYAQVITADLGGPVDLVVGESYGGMIAQHLAAQHGGSWRHLAVVAAAAEVSAWGKEVDARLAGALTRGDTSEAGRAFAEYALPGPRSRWLRHLVGPLIGRTLLSGQTCPAPDVLVEVEAELSFDSRPVLPAIAAPVLLLCGDRDRFFPPELVEETARLIPDCSLVVYEGQGHMRVASSRRVVRDVLAHIARG
jgi:pimeloyl-ACP methyl ester carboxylesterase